MKPVIALVGRPNVGKSTLFNRLTRSRDAIVVDVPGVTRDRHYGEARVGSRSFIVIDTGGLEPGGAEGVVRETARQAEQAIAEADAVVLVVDARAGLTALDRAIADQLRRSARSVVVAANKAEGLVPEIAAVEFHALGLGAPLAISAAHGEGVAALVEAALAHFTELGARCARGRIDPYGATMPYAGFRQVLTALVDEILTGSDEALAQWRRRLNTALSPSAQAVVELVRRHTNGEQAGN